MQNEIQEAAYDFQLAVEKGDAIVVGVNKFQADEEQIPIMRIDEQIERDQVERLQSIREKRNAADAENSIKAIESAANGTENLLPHILTAVEAHVTVGEISNTLRKVWGEYRESVTI